MSSIKTIITALILVVTLSSCNQGETLQSYYVMNQETPDFMSVDIPTSFVNLDKVTLTDEQTEAYESVDKLNMLAFELKEDNKEVYQAELAKVKTILANPKYEELFRGGNSTDGKIIIKYIGTDTSIDELIVFANSKEKGFGIVRVLGDDMEPAKIMTLGDALKDADFDDKQLQGFSDFFK